MARNDWEAPAVLPPAGGALSSARPPVAAALAGDPWASPHEGDDRADEDWQWHELIQGARTASRPAGPAPTPTTAVTPPASDEGDRGAAIVAAKRRANLRPAPRLSRPQLRSNGTRSAALGAAASNRS